MVGAEGAGGAAEGAGAAEEEVTIVETKIRREKG